MYLSEKDAIALAKKIAKVKTGNKVILAPSFTAIPAVGRAVKLPIAGQNMFWQGYGAYTGEICGEELKSLGCKYVILGHSERRKYYKETDEMIGQKVKYAQKLGLTPVLCVGETEEEKKAGKTLEVVKRQLKIALLHMSFPRRRESRIFTGSPNSRPDAGLVGDDNKVDTKKLIIAYEPVWAIGTGNPENPQNANMVQGEIKKQAGNAPVLYGGSVDSKNFAGFLAQKNIDGLLVGGASTKWDEFSKIIK